MKNIRDFLSENFQFLEVKFSIYLNRHVFVMMVRWHFKRASVSTIISIHHPHMTERLLTLFFFFFYLIWSFMAQSTLLMEPASVAQLDAPSDWRPGGRGFNPHRGRQHSFVEIDHEIFSTVILSLPLIQEGQLSVSGERMCTILVNRLED